MSKVVDCGRSALEAEVEQAALRNMLMEDDDAGIPPEQWWIVAAISGAPAFFYLWLSEGEQFKGCVMASAIASVIFAAGFYLSYPRSLFFWFAVFTMVLVQVVAISVIPISNHHGPTFGVFLPMILIDAGLSYWTLRLIIPLIGR